MSDDQLSTQAMEGIKIERERKYSIPNQDTAKKIADTLPETISISFQDKRLDSDMAHLLKDMFLEPEQNADEITINALQQNNKSRFIKKSRPNYYYDTKDFDLLSNNLSFSLRQRAKDWMVTVKLRPKEMVKKSVQKGIFERIEVDCPIDNTIIQAAKNGNDIDINQVIENQKELKETYHRQLEKYVAGIPLEIKNSFEVLSSRVLYPFRNNGLLQVSVDSVLTKPGVKDIFEIEIELKYGGSKTWLDDVASRVFDYISYCVIHEIKKSTTSIDPTVLDDVLKNVTNLSKVEKVRNVTSPQLFRYSLSKKTLDLSELAKSVVDFCQSEYVRGIHPITLCPYWVDISKVQDDVKPPVPTEETDEKGNKRRAKRKRLSEEDIEKYREELLISTHELVDQTLRKMEANPYLLVDPDLFTKIHVVRLSPTSFLMTFIFPFEEYQQSQFFLKTHRIFQNLFQAMYRESSISGLFEQVIVDCLHLTKKQEITETTRINLDNMIYYSIEKDEDSYDLQGLLERRFGEIQKYIDKMVLARHRLRQRGERGPIALLLAEDQNKRSTYYFPFKKEARIPLTVEALGGME